MSKFHKKKEEHVANLLQIDVGKFGHYQQIPPAIIKKAPGLKNINYNQDQVELDSERYAWLKSVYRGANFDAIEIGANLGYFSLSLAAELGASVEVYEPISVYMEVCKILSRLSGIECLIHIQNNSLEAKDLKFLRNVDLIINLNVLHHAGCTFDIDMVQTRSEWEVYAKRYLTLLSHKTRYLFFQTGNTWKGQSLFSGENSIHFLFELLNDGNWEVLSIGVIDDPNNLVYSTYSASEIDRVPRIYCRRNRMTDLVDYFLDGTVIASLKTGLAQRPLWFCRSNGF